MLSLVFATNNANKVKEMRSVLGEGFEILSLKEAGIDIEIPEPHATLQKNALEKASTIHNLVNQNCFSEDTGLEVFALNNEPGVKSARYAGDSASNTDNINKLLRKLNGMDDRRAQFRTVICLFWDGETHFFEGLCPGVITSKPAGLEGFGYDPVFIPNGDERTFAQMPLEEKNRYSHRKKAMEKLITFLNNYGARKN